MKQDHNTEATITVIKENKKPDKQQNRLKQQALLTTKSQCLSIFSKRTESKSQTRQIKSKLNQMICILPKKL